MANVNNITYIGIFLEGLMAFLSPCVLPLIPLYMSYLSSNAKDIDQNGQTTYKAWKVFLTTICFVLGISMTFFIMGLGVSFIRDFIFDYKNIIGIIGGLVLIVFALNQLGFINVNFLNREHRLENKTDTKNMNYLKAFGLGFAFSFAWTPCIGPMLANVILLASTSEPVVGNFMILLYTLGFTIPFVLLGLFFQKALEFIKKKQKLLLNISKLAAIIIILFGCFMVYDNSKTVVNMQRDYKNVQQDYAKLQKDYANLLAQQNGEQPENNTDSENSNDDITYMYEFELEDQFGNVHKLSDSKGKYIVLNFVSSWCTYCKKEVPDFKQYYANRDDDVECYYVMNEAINKSNNGSTIAEFVEEYDIDVPVLIDDGTMFNYIGINSFPMNAYIGPDGSVIGVQGGMMNTDQLKEIENIARKLYEER